MGGYTEITNIFGLRFMMQALNLILFIDVICRIGDTFYIKDWSIPLVGFTAAGSLNLFAANIYYC